MSPPARVHASIPPAQAARVYARTSHVIATTRAHLLPLEVVSLKLPGRIPRRTQTSRHSNHDPHDVSECLQRPSVPSPVASRCCDLLLLIYRRARRVVCLPRRHACCAVPCRAVMLPRQRLALLPPSRAASVLRAVRVASSFPKEAEDGNGLRPLLQ